MDWKPFCGGFEPSDEQVAILVEWHKWLTVGRKNKEDLRMIMNAFAGSGKSTELEWMVNVARAYAPELRIFIGVFNKTAKISIHNKVNEGISKANEVYVATGHAAAMRMLVNQDKPLWNYGDEIDFNKSFDIVSHLATTTPNFFSKDEMPVMGKIMGQLASALDLIFMTLTNNTVENIANLINIGYCESYLFDDNPTVSPISVSGTDWLELHREFSKMMRHTMYNQQFDLLFEDKHFELLHKATEIAIKQSVSGKVDGDPTRSGRNFNDALHLVSMMDISHPVYDVVLVDEAQDTNNALYEVYLRHLKLGHPNALIMVGDPKQSIQVWAGAHPAQMKRIAIEHKASMFTLSTSYRCSKAVADYVRTSFHDLSKFVVPDNALDGYIGGMSFSQMCGDMQKLIKSGDKWKYSKYKETYGVLLLARTNADAIGWFIRMFVDHGLPVVVTGAESLVADFRIALKDILKGNDPEIHGNVGLDQLLDTIHIMQEAEVRLLVNKYSKRKKQVPPDELNKIYAFYETLTLVCSAIAESIGKRNVRLRDIMQRFDIFSTKGSTYGKITIMTMHKSKGLEGRNVYLLPESRPIDLLSMSGMELEQEMNLRYVAYTRAKNAVYQVTFDPKNTGESSSANESSALVIDYTHKDDIGDEDVLDKLVSEIKKSLDACPSDEKFAEARTRYITECGIRYGVDVAVKVSGKL